MVLHICMPIVPDFDVAGAALCILRKARVYRKIFKEAHICLCSVKCIWIYVQCKTMCAAQYCSPNAQHPLHAKQGVLLKPKSSLTLVQMSDATSTGSSATESEESTYRPTTQVNDCSPLKFIIDTVHLPQE